jgi:hypothetical protein
MGGQKTVYVPVQRVETPEQPLRTALDRAEPNDPVVLVDRDEIDLGVVAIFRTPSYRPRSSLKNQLSASVRRGEDDRKNMPASRALRSDARTPCS